MTPTLITPPFLDLDDLTHGFYPQYRPVPGRDPLLNDILAFAVEKGAPAPVCIQPVYQSKDGGVGIGTIPGLPLAQHADGNVLAPVDIVFRTAGKVHIADAYTICSMPQGLVNDLNSLFLLNIPPYPGYALRHPVYQSPVGEYNPKHPWDRPGFRMFTPSAAFKPEDWAVGGEHSELRQGLFRRWVLWYSWSTLTSQEPGSLVGPTGLGSRGAFQYAWQEVPYQGTAPIPQERL